LASIAFHDPRLSGTAGGGETVTLQLMSLLMRTGHKVTAVTRKVPRSPLFSEFIARETQLHCEEIAVPEIRIDALPEGESLARQIWHCDRLAPESLCFNLASRVYHEKNKFDLVVVSFVPDLACLATSSPIQLNVFGLPPNQATADAERPLLDRCAGLTFASHYTKRQFGSLFGFEPTTDLGPVVHASVHPVFFESKVTRKDFDACYVGRLMRRKGLYTILESVDWLKRQKHREITLAIGGDGPEREALEQRARELGIAHQITWCGTVGTAEVARVLDCSRTFLYPTLAPEAFGCGNIEAMARGVPVITTNLGGTSDYVTPGENAVVCDPGSSESLARSIDRLLNDSGLRTRLRKAGFVTAQRFHPTAVGTQWIEAFNDRLCAASLGNRVTQY